MWGGFLVIGIERFISRAVVRLHRIFCFAPGVLDLSFGLLRCALRLSFGISGPFTDLAFSAASDVFCLTLNAIFVHENLRGSCTPKAGSPWVGTHCMRHQATGFRP